MQEYSTKVSYSAWWRQWALPVLVLLALSTLPGCNAGKVNYSNGRYHSARDMARIKASERARGRGRAPVTIKTKSKTAAGRTKIVSRRPGAAPIAANVSRPIAEVIQTARSYQGVPYKYGGTTRLGMDCSGLLHESFAAINVNIPRSSNEQAVWGAPVKPQELQPGDLVFFGASPGSNTITHVGMVTVATPESVQFIHSSSSLGVIENALETDYYLSRFIKAVRPRL